MPKRGRKSTDAKKKAPRKQPSASQELSEDALDKVSGGLGYGGKLQVSDSTRVTQTPLNIALSPKTIGYGG